MKTFQQSPIYKKYEEKRKESIEFDRQKIQSLYDDVKLDPGSNSRARQKSRMFLSEKYLDKARTEYNARFKDINLESKSLYDDYQEYNDKVKELSNLKLNRKIFSFDQEKHLSKINNKRILFTHGDKFDFFINARPFLTELASGIYYILQKIDKKQKFTRKLKTKIKTWHGAAHDLTIRIAQYCYNNKYNAVCFGHTHVPKQYYVGGVECVNLGSQCELPITYAMIDDSGKIELKQYE